jgi:hypothetical protein
MSKFIVKMKVQEDSKSSDKELVTILNIDNYPELLHKETLV